MNLLELIKKKNILVIGDVMLDTYYSGEVRRISPEAPVPVFRKTGERGVPGGAANVAANLVAAGQSVSILSVIGKDAAGERLKEQLSLMGIDIKFLYTLRECTTEKVRFIAANNQQVLRLDNEVSDEIGDSVCNQLIETLQSIIDEFQIIVLSDYGKGLLTEKFTKAVICLAREYGKLTLVDVKGSNAAKYSGAFLVKPNLSELCDMTKLPVGTEEEIVAASNALREVCKAEYILTTCGGRGMVLVGNGQSVSIAADDHEVFDVTGAGDTALAYLAASLANGCCVRKAVEIANHAAGIQVTKVGTTAISPWEVNNAISRRNERAVGKLLDRNIVSRLRDLYPEKKIIFTNGCFDILHVGHIRYLKQASELGDILVIGLNSDASVKRLKGKDRPINSEADRAEILASLECVNYIVIFDEDTPYGLIKDLHPDVLVKGKDYVPENVVGKDLVEGWGGELVLMDFVDGRSTTGLIRRIAKEKRERN